MKIGIHFQYESRGPGKVVSNLITGLDILGIKHLENAEGDFNVILQQCPRLNGDLSNCIIGPNICVLPIDDNIVLQHSGYKKILVPSEWVKNLYSRWIPAEKIEVWAVGIDTELFSPIESIKENDFLIYFKRRNAGDLHSVTNKLNIAGKKYEVIEYGSYSEGQFLEKIRKSKFAISINGTESQGIAIQEILSCDVPILAWDVDVWSDRGDINKCEATSIPYWGNECGEIFKKAEELDNLIQLVQEKSYSPRNYIVNNLGAAKKAFDLLKIIDNL